MTVVYPTTPPVAWTLSPSIDAAVEPTEAEARAVGCGPSEGWPYGPNISSASRRALVNWALPQGLTNFEPRRRCLHRVVGQSRRCGALQKTDHDGVVLYDHRRWDHPSFWRRPDGTTLLLAQPYGDPRTADYEAIAQQWPVHVEITDAIFYGAFAVLVTPAG